MTDVAGVAWLSFISLEPELIPIFGDDFNLTESFEYKDIKMLVFFRFFYII